MQSGRTNIYHFVTFWQIKERQEAAFAVQCSVCVRVCYHLLQEGCCFCHCEWRARKAPLQSSRHRTPQRTCSQSMIQGHTYKITNCETVCCCLFCCLLRRWMSFQIDLKTRTGTTVLIGKTGINSHKWHDTKGNCIKSLQKVVFSFCTALWGGWSVKNNKKIKNNRSLTRIWDSLLALWPCSTLCPEAELW